MLQFNFPSYVTLSVLELQSFTYLYATKSSLKTLGVFCPSPVTNKVATLEKAERQKAIKTYLDANDPEGPALQSRVKRVRQHAEDDYEGVSDFMWKTTDLYLPF